MLIGEKPMRKQLALLSVVSTVFLLSACGSSAPHRISDEEMSAAWGGQTYKDLIIVGVYSDRATRVGSETAFAEELTERGVKSSPSYDVIRDLSELSSEAAIRNALASTTYDAILTVTTIQEAEEYTYGDALETRGMVFLLTGRTQAGAFEQTANLIAWANSGSYSLHVGLWDSKTQEPIWQVTTDSVASDSEAADRRALADFVVERLRAKGLL